MLGRAGLQKALNIELSVTHFVEHADAVREEASNDAGSHKIKWFWF